MNGVQTRLKCKPNVKRCKRFVFAAHSPLLHPNTLKTKAIIHFQTDHILTRFVFPPLYKSDWRVVVDEFQCLLADSSFKSEIELHFLDNSRSFPYVTFLSATPILDKYLEQIDHFKDMNYYQLDWEEKDIVRVYRERTKNPINAALEIVRYYQNGNYPSVYVNGETNLLNTLSHYK